MARPLAGYATVKLCSACLRTHSTCSRATPSNHSRKSSTVAPPSRFSNSAATGTRVPLKSQAPLTFPGTRSTAEQLLQSSIPPLYRCIPQTARTESFRNSRLFGDWQECTVQEAIADHNLRLNQELTVP